MRLALQRRVELSVVEQEQRRQVEDMKLPRQCEIPTSVDLKYGEVRILLAVRRQYLLPVPAGSASDAREDDQRRARRLRQHVVKTELIKDRKRHLRIILPIRAFADNKTARDVARL